MLQNFAKSLLDVADNLGRASSAAKESFSKIDEPEDAGGAFQQLKVLLQGVEMTEKQLLEVIVSLSQYFFSSFFDCMAFICAPQQILLSVALILLKVKVSGIYLFLI